MVARIEAGSNWEIHHIQPNKKTFPKITVCVNYSIVREDTPNRGVLIVDTGEMVNIRKVCLEDLWLHVKTIQGVYLPKDRDNLDFNFPISAFVQIFEAGSPNYLKITNDDITYAG